MKILHELSWLWETLGIALVAAAICIACAALTRILNEGDGGMICILL